jgi:hypothetical protein
MLPRNKRIACNKNRTKIKKEGCYSKPIKIMFYVVREYEHGTFWESGLCKACYIKDMKKIITADGQIMEYSTCTQPSGLINLTKI